MKLSVDELAKSLSSDNPEVRRLAISSIASLPKDTIVQNRYTDLLLQGLSDEDWRVRRDAAGEKIWFSTGIIEPHIKVNITIVDDRKPIHYRIRYTVDVENDLLEKMVFSMAQDGVFGQAIGEMSFSYLSKVEGVGDEFDVPKPVKAEIKQVKANASILWPIYLAQPAITKKLATSIEE